MHWVYIILLSVGGAVIGAIAAYMALGLATASSTSDLDQERWVALSSLARLVYAVESGEQDAIDEALAVAREVLGR